MSDVKGRSVRLASRIVDNLVLQILLASAPLVIGAVTAYATTYPKAAIVALSVGWSLSGLIGILWFRNHRANQAERAIRLARALFVSDDSVLPWWITNANRSSSDAEAREKLRASITNLLISMCHVLAYRIKFQTKGATFLLIEHTGTGPRFDTFARAGQDDVEVTDEVHERLPVDKGLAAQAIRRRSCVCLRDCEKNPPDSGIEWVSIHTPERFRGRACTRVGTWIDGHELDIGALCFDVKQPWLLQAEDQRIMEIFAIKVAGLWAMYLRRQQLRLARIGPQKASAGDTASRSGS